MALAYILYLRGASTYKFYYNWILNSNTVSALNAFSYKLKWAFKAEL